MTASELRENYNLNLQTGSCCSEKSFEKLTVRYLLSTKQTTHTFSTWHVNTAEHLAAEESKTQSGKKKIRRRANLQLCANKLHLNFKCI